MFLPVGDPKLIVQPVNHGLTCGAMESPTCDVADEDTPQHPDTEKRRLSRDSTSSVVVGKVSKEQLRTITDDVAAGSADKTTTPWLTESGEVIWSPSRIRLGKILFNKRFDALMGVIILFNFALVWYEADVDAQCYPQYQHDPMSCPSKVEKVPWLEACNWALLSLYSIEACLRLFVQRLEYFKNPYNNLDFFVVVMGWLSEIFVSLINLAFLRVFRVARLTRAFRVIITIRELYFLLTGFMSSVKAIFFGTIMIFALLIVYSILLVEFVHPVNAGIIYEECPGCDQGFSSVWQCTLTLFNEVIAGGSWIMNHQLTKQAPYSAPLMVIIVITVTLGVMNLILTVIVERAAEARERDHQEQVKQKRHQAEAQKLELLKLCFEIDKDGNGQVTKDELLEAYDEKERFRNIMKLMDVKRDNIDAIFRLLDADGSGGLDYKEFCNELYTLQSNDQRMMIAMTRLGVQELNNQMSSRLSEVAKRTEMHDELLHRIDGKLSKLLGNTPFSLEEPSLPFPRTDASKIPAPMASLVDKQIPGVPENSVLVDLVQVQQHVEDLSAFQANIAKSVEEQASTLIRHAQYLNSFGEWLPRAWVDDDTIGESGIPMKTVSNFKPGRERLNRIGQSVQRLQANVSVELFASMQDIQQKLELTARTVEANKQLLVLMGKQLPSPAPTCQLPVLSNL